MKPARIDVGGGDDPEHDCPADMGNRASAATDRDKATTTMTNPTGRSTRLARVVGCALAGERGR